MSVVDKKVKELLSKRAINLVDQEKGQFLSRLFIVPVKNRDQNPVINLKELTEFISYQHFKVEIQHCQK